MCSVMVYSITFRTLKALVVEAVSGGFMRLVFNINLLLWFSGWPRSLIQLQV